MGTFGFNRLFFLDTAHYWMVGGPNVASTVDGGRRWTVHRNVVPTGLFLNQPVFSSLSDGWVIATSAKAAVPNIGLYKTTDGGAHWVAVPTPSFDQVP